VISGHERRGLFAGEFFVLLSLKVFAARANFPMVNKFEHGDLLAPRRQQRQVPNRFSFAAPSLRTCFASLREIFRFCLRRCRAGFPGHGRFLHVNRGDTPPDDRWRFLSPPARSPRTVAWRRDSEAGSGNPRARSPHRCPFDPVLRLRLSPCARPTSPARLKTSSLAGRRWKF
jgi:hypothetical protein